MSVHQMAAGDSRNLGDPFMRVNNWLTRHLATLRGHSYSRRLLALEQISLPSHSEHWAELTLHHQQLDPTGSARFQLNSRISPRSNSSNEVVSCHRYGDSPKTSWTECPRGENLPVKPWANWGAAGAYTSPLFFFSASKTPTEPVMEQPNFRRQTE